MSLTVTTAARVSDVPHDAWDALAAPDDPFTEHAFLAALEEAGCVGAETGWLPAPVLVWEGEPGGSRLVGAAPAYVKDNSYGEYIFDWSWADACRRAGVRYYPKVVVAVPFTPATGRRLLTHPGVDQATVRGALVGGARALADAAGASSVHGLFTTPDEARALETLGFRPRLSYQFHWTDRGFGDFDGYLAAMTSKRRKEIRRERRQAAAVGLDVGVERVADLSPADLDAVFSCYRATIDVRTWQQAYLNRAWFELLPARLGHSALAATARRDGRIVAAALAFNKGRNLYGRYWGAVEDVRALHFELSYYRLIDWALAHGVSRFEAGAQGEHKLARGFLPATTHSAHWLRHPGLDEAVARFLTSEARQVRNELEALERHGPFHEEGP